MSEINMEGFFDALKAERDRKQAKEVLKASKEREDQWWSLYKKGLINYDKNTTVI